MKSEIKFLVMDVDGTLTDGKIYMGNQGEFFKAFDIKDGYAIKEILPKYGIIPIVITARESVMLENRCKELGIEEFYQGRRNKLETLNEVIEKYSSVDAFSLSNVAYVGDDILDIQCMIPVKEAGGLAICPSDAARDVKAVADYICISKCGEGAIREFIEWLVGRITCDNIEFIKEISLVAYNFIKNFNPSTMLDGSYNLDFGVFANVMTYFTKPLELTKYETHKKYIDIQYLIYGSELMVTEDIMELQTNVLNEYNSDKDVTLYNYDLGVVKIFMPGDVMIMYPEDAHRGSIAIDKSMRVRKIVLKIPV